MELQPPATTAPALASDLVEEFRAPLVEGLAIYLFNNRILDRAMFTRCDGACHLSPEGRKAVIRAWEGWLDRPVLAPDGRRVLWRRLIALQINAYAAHARGEREYTPLSHGLLKDGGGAMAETEMLMVFSYDVTENRNRRRVAKVLESACVRVQKSVFEAVMTEKAAKSLADAAAHHLGQGDSLRVYAIGAHGRNRCQSWGPCPCPNSRIFTCCRGEPLPIAEHQPAPCWPYCSRFNPLPIAEQR